LKVSIACKAAAEEGLPPPAWRIGTMGGLGVTLVASVAIVRRSSGASCHNIGLSLEVQIEGSRKVCGEEEILPEEL